MVRDEQSAQTNGQEGGKQNGDLEESGAGKTAISNLGGAGMSKYHMARKCRFRW